MRFQVPQFVDIEDKVVGPLTLRQFLIYVGAVLGLIPVFLVVDLSLFLTIALPVIGLAVMFAHVKINQKTLFQVVMNAVTFYGKGQLYIWRRTNQLKLLSVSGDEYGELIAQTGPSLSLAERARELETQGHVVQEDETDIIGGETEVKT